MKVAHTQCVCWPILSTAEWVETVELSAAGFTVATVIALESCWTTSIALKQIYHTLVRLLFFFLRVFVGLYGYKYILKLHWITGHAKPHIQQLTFWYCLSYPVWLWAVRFMGLHRNKWCIRAPKIPDSLLTVLALSNQPYSKAWVLSVNSSEKHECGLGLVGITSLRRKPFAFTTCLKSIRLTNARPCYSIRHIHTGHQRELGHYTCPKGMTDHMRWSWKLGSNHYRRGEKSLQ